MANTNDNLSDPSLSGVKGRAATPEEAARRDGYVKGRNDENYTQSNLRAQERVVAESRSRARENDSAASGMLLGLIVALIAAGVGAALYFLTGDRTNSVVPVAVPQIEKETTEKETTIIEREVSAPPVSLPDVQVDLPDVNVPDINVTNEASAPESAAEPAAEPEPKEAPSEEPVTETTESE